MGSVARFNLKGACSDFGCRYFLETGTGLGGSLQVASQAPFERLYSIEIVPALAAKARQRFSGDQRVEIVDGTSEHGLASILPRIPDDAPILFFLDAHFPGADFGLASYDAEKNVDIRLPLERELDLIRRARPKARDVFIIDDLRIYMDGPYKNGNVPPAHQTLPPEARNVDFVLKMFGASHDCRPIYEDEGYLALTPRAAAAPAATPEAKAKAAPKTAAKKPAKKAAPGRAKRRG